MSRSSLFEPLFSFIRFASESECGFDLSATIAHIRASLGSNEQFEVLLQRAIQVYQVVYVNFVSDDKIPHYGYFRTNYISIRSSLSCDEKCLVFLFEFCNVINQPLIESIRSQEYQSADDYAQACERQEYQTLVLAREIYLSQVEAGYLPKSEEKFPTIWPLVALLDMDEEAYLAWSKSPESWPTEGTHFAFYVNQFKERMNSPKSPS